MKLKKNVIMIMITQQWTTTLAEMELKEQLNAKLCHQQEKNCNSAIVEKEKLQ